MTRASDSPTAYLQDRPVLSPWQARLLTIAGPIVVTLAGLLLSSAPQLARLEDVTLDWRFDFRGPRPPRDDIVVIEIDEASRRGLSESMQRFNLREYLPAVVGHLTEAGALVVAFDFWLDDFTDADADRALAKTIADSDVVLAVAHTDGKLKRAVPLFLASQPNEGTINVEPDADGVLRRLPGNLYLDVLNADGTLARVPHLPLTVALYRLWADDPNLQIDFADGVARIGGRTVAPRELIDYSAPRGGGWRTISLASAYRGDFPPELVAGAVVLIGESRAITDFFSMPIAHAVNPGVYYHANVVAQVLDGRRFDTSFATGRRRTAVIAGLGLAAGIFAWHQRRWWEYRRSTLLLSLYLAVGVLVFAGGWIGLALAGFARGVVVPLVAPLVTMGLALGAGLAVQWIVVSASTRRLMERTRRIEALFGQSVSHHVLDALRSDPRQIVETQVREVSVLFCDLRNFTATASGCDPRDVAAMLNEYFNHVTAAVFEEDGFLDKFVGDEIMAVFSVPLPQADHADRAVRAAVNIKRRLAELNRLRAARGQAPLDCGVGIHTGPAAAGHIGSRRRSNYTVVGDTVNLAARIEGFTRGGEILVSSACRDHLRAPHDVSFWKTVEIRGVEGAVDLHRVAVDQSRDRKESEPRP